MTEMYLCEFLSQHVTLLVHANKKTTARQRYEAVVLNEGGWARDFN
jgi:hypothetical protein